MASPRVSVLLGAYDNETTLERAARSILEQTVTDLELLIVDDGSSDSTAALATSIADSDPRARLISMGHNVGISRSLNTALEQACAPVVAVQDADDHSDPERLERSLALLNARRDVAVVGVRMREVGPDGRELAPRTRLASGDVRRALTRWNPIPNTAAAFRRDVALALGGYDPRYRYAAEYDLWLRIADRHVVWALPDVLATRTMSGANVAARAERAQIAESIEMRVRTLRRRRSVRGATGLISPSISYATPLALKRAMRRAKGQAT